MHEDVCTVNDKLSTPEKTHKQHKTNKYTNKILQVNHGHTTVHSRDNAKTTLLK